MKHVVLAPRPAAPEVGVVVANLLPDRPVDLPVPQVGVHGLQFTIQFGRNTVLV